MKMQEKKLKRFNVYKVIANVLFILVLIFGIIGLLAALITESVLVARGVDIATVIQDFAVQFIPDINLPAGIFPHAVIYAMIFHMGLGLALSAYIIKSVANMFKTIVETKTPFGSKTVRVIRSMGIAFFIYTGIVVLIGLIVSAITASLHGFGGADFNISFKFSTLLYGLLLMALAEMFEFGAGLQEDNESIV
jgi:hypothetical protein